MSKTQQVQKEVDDVIGIMHTNIEKVVQRGEKLESLQSKTDDLQQGALQFKRGATTIRRQMWWKDLKFKIMIGIIFFVILAIIIASIAKGSKSDTKVITPSKVFSNIKAAFEGTPPPDTITTNQVNSN
jgi:vesicle-associated membrane protein 4